MVADVFARPDHVGGGAAAEQQPDGLDENRLPCPGLAGQDIEARPEFHFGGVNHGEMGDAAGNGACRAGEEREVQC